MRLGDFEGEWGRLTHTTKAPIGLSNNSGDKTHTAKCLNSSSTPLRIEDDRDVVRDAAHDLLEGRPPIGAELLEEGRVRLVAHGDVFRVADQSLAKIHRSLRVCVSLAQLCRVGIKAHAEDGVFRDALFWYPFFTTLIECCGRRTSFAGESLFTTQTSPFTPQRLTLHVG